MADTSSDITTQQAAAAARANGRDSSAEPDLPSLRRRQPLEIHELVLPTEPVKIFDKTYEMLSLEHLGQVGKQQCLIYWEKISEIRNRITDDPLAAGVADDRELELQYDLFLGITMPKLPAKVKERLTIGQKARLFSHFLSFQEEMDQLARKAEGMTRAEVEAVANLMEQIAQASTGATGSPASPASTPAASDPLIAQPTPAT